jgi:hypothetical protein
VKAASRRPTPSLSAFPRRSLLGYYPDPMHRQRLIPIVVSLVAASCHASYPAAPDPALTAVQVFYARAMTGAAVGSTYAFTAYAVRSDGAYEDITGAATWTLSDPQIMSPRTAAGAFVANSAGQVDVFATYQSLRGVLSLPVIRIDSPAYPRLLILGGDPQLVGTKAPVYLSLQRNPWSSEWVTSLATWTSVDPSVVTIDGGAVVAVGVGTTRISATYGDQTVECGLSIHPRK